MPSKAEYQYLREQAIRLRPLYDSLRKLRNNRKVDRALALAMATAADTIEHSLDQLTRGILDYAKTQYPEVIRGQYVRILSKGLWFGLKRTRGHQIGKVVEFSYFEPSDYAEEFYGDLKLRGFAIKKDGTRGHPVTVLLDAENRCTFEIVISP